MPDPARKGEKVYRGIPVSGGVSRGPAFILGQVREALPERTINEADIPKELIRLHDAILVTRQQLLAVQQKVEDAMGSEDASIFDAHLLMLEDQTVLDEVTRVVRQQHINVEQAFHKVVEKYATTLAAMDDDYLRERASDLRDVAERLLNNLMGRPEISLANLNEPSIVVSHDFSPSITAQMDRKKVLGFATDVGGKTSHTAIMARSIEIPAIVGLKNISHVLEPGDDVLLDGYNGMLVVNPTDQTLFEYGQLVLRQNSAQERLRCLTGEPAVTADGQRITLSANIGTAEEVEAVKASGAEGVGLFRTEYLFLNRSELPGEEEQYLAYRTVAAALKPNPVVIRTLDLGGDKVMPQTHGQPEMNPFLGWRAIRLCLHEREIFRAQLRAILRASVEGNIKLMYPMISCLEELLQANAFLDECREELRAEKIPFGEEMEVGMMIEIPSAALVAESLAHRVDFFSIGSNDLIQYSLAVDRLNERVAHLYQPTHPAIIRLVDMTVRAADKESIWTGVCGEVANDLSMVPLLLGLGVTELSVAPPAVARVKFIIRNTLLSEAKELAKDALTRESAAEIQTRAEAYARKIAPSLFD